MATVAENPNDVLSYAYAMTLKHGGTMPPVPYHGSIAAAAHHLLKIHDEDLWIEVDHLGGNKYHITAIIDDSPWIDDRDPLFEMDLELH